MKNKRIILCVGRLKSMAGFRCPGKSVIFARILPKHLDYEIT